MTTTPIVRRTGRAGGCRARRIQAAVRERAGAGMGATARSRPARGAARTQARLRDDSDRGRQGRRRVRTRLRRPVGRRELRRGEVANGLVIFAGRGGRERAHNVGQARSTRSSSSSRTDPTERSGRRSMSSPRRWRLSDGRHEGHVMAAETQPHRADRRPGADRDNDKERIMSTLNAGDVTAPQTSLGSFSSPGASPTPWESTEWALRRIQKFQLCTVRPDGRPHVTPLLAIWAFGAMWFTTGDNEQKAKNLSANGRCALTTGTDTLTGMDYVIEGIATLETHPATRKPWRPLRRGLWLAAHPRGRNLASTGRRRSDRECSALPGPAGQGFRLRHGSESSQTRYRWR